MTTMQSTDPIEVSDIAASTELSSEEMAEVQGGRAKTSTDERKSGGDPGTKTTGITIERVAQ